ncbi:High mobility group HMG-I/HMG-Y [Penicillium bovifimosum]|uniref:Thymocyte nuclear protein 1 n=1 Tax=Penicillium bovifimosum TaxID=126998 RepID=A0A9W9GUU3_9EURO|nr:High mobility group HMG-I/HMG-Y [Penicillium bovifimosum]KAJ5130321.1 High mobility group HMG-I/HMG-Y [Penicillium bovifimosum]
MPPKRKSERAVSANDTTATPSKRVKNTVDATPASAAFAASAPVSDVIPQSSEKRGRGRPRKYPIDSTPKPVPDGPKRGRGRPRKIVSEQEPEVATPSVPKRGRGRPRKEPDSTTPVTPKIKKKDGRGRPRKNPLPNGEAETAESKPAVNSNPDTGRSFWLMKAEPESRIEKGKDVKFSIDDLAAADVPEPWDGVRNHVAKNLMRDMRKGDYAFFYHSNCKVPGIVGVMEIVREHSTDESAFDTNHPYYDPKSKREDPKWVVVHVEYRRKLGKQVTLHELKSHGQPGKPLENLQMIKQSRLSVSSVTPAQWKYILELAGEEPQEEFTRESSGEEEEA